MKKINNLINYLNNNGFQKEADYLIKESSLGLGFFLFLFTGCKNEEQCFNKPDENKFIEYIVKPGDGPERIVKKVYGEELGSVIINDTEAFEILIDLVKKKSLGDFSNLHKDLKYFHPGQVLNFPNPEDVRKNFESAKKQDVKRQDVKKQDVKRITWEEYRKDSFDMNQKIPGAENFTFREVSDSDSRPELTSGSKNKLTTEQQFNNHMKAVKILQRIRDEFGSIIVHSGYREHKLNSAIGGEKNSCHRKGVAFDISFENGGGYSKWQKMKKERKEKWSDIGECFYYKKRGHIHFSLKPCGGNGEDKNWGIFNK